MTCKITCDTPNIVFSDFNFTLETTGYGGSFGCASDRPVVKRFDPKRIRQHSVVEHFFVGIDHDIFSMVILSLPLIQEGQFSVNGERMCTSTG